MSVLVPLNIFIATLSIRDDFRTTVEYLIKLLELEPFRENTITTGWLDSLISNKLTAERPDATLAVVCGAVTKVYLASEAYWTEYKRIPTLEDSFLDMYCLCSCLAVVD